MENFYLKILNNPFKKGYDKFTIDRTLVITNENSDRLIYRDMPVNLQFHQDWQLFGKPCLFDSNQVYFLDSQQTPDSPETQSGRIVSVAYQIYGYTGMYCCHIGDAVTMDAARSVVDQFSFIPGHYEKCWHISDKHLPASVFSTLQELFYERRPENKLMEVFPMHAGKAMGIQFLLTLSRNRAGDIHNDFAQFREQLVQLLGESTPECLIDLLSLSYIAGTRMLILSEQAPVIKNLPVFDS